MDTIFEFVYYIGIIACVSSLNVNKTVQATAISHRYVEHDSIKCEIDTLDAANSLQHPPLFFGASQAKRLSEVEGDVFDADGRWFFDAERR